MMNTADYEMMKSSQLVLMDDLCNIIHIVRSSGTYSTSSTETRSMVSGVVCGFQFTNGQITKGGQVLLVDYDAVLRLPSSQPVFVTDEVQLMEKGDTMVSGTFRPASNPVVNSSVQRVLLKRVAP
jgi:hypothetical protein